MPSIKEREYFDKIAEVFDTRYNVYVKPAGKLRVKRRIELFSRHCQLSQGLKILEIGCGTGEYTKALMQHGCFLFATDISYNMLSKAAGKMPKEGNIYFFVSDIGRLSVKDNTFDAIIGNSILHHLDTEKTLDNIFRILKTGGRFIFSEPNMLNPQIFLQKHIKFIKKLSGDSPQEWAFYRWQIKKMFEKRGFGRVSVKPFDFLHPYTPGPLVKIINRIGLVLEEIPLIKEVSGSLLIAGIK